MSVIRIRRTKSSVTQAPAQHRDFAKAWLPIFGVLMTQIPAAKEPMEHDLAVVGIPGFARRIFLTDL